MIETRTDPERQVNGLIDARIEDGKIYWCGWRPVDGHWEPVVYAIQDE